MYVQNYILCCNFDTNSRGIWGHMKNSIKNLNLRKNKYIWKNTHPCCGCRAPTSWSRPGFLVSLHRNTINHSPSTRAEFRQADKISSPVLISPWWEVINIGRSTLTFCSLSWAVRRDSPHSSKIYPRKVFWKRFCGWISRKNPIANYSPRIKRDWEDLGAVPISTPRSREILAWNRPSRSREDTQTSWGATIGFVTSLPRRNTKVCQPLSTTGKSAAQFWHRYKYIITRLGME